MAVQHVDAAGDELHEEKHISSATPTDHGKVVTPDGVTAGVAELRFLTYQEISDNIETQTITIPMATAATYFISCPFDGNLKTTHVVIDDAINADTVLSWQVVLLGQGAARDITITASGSAAGDTYGEFGFEVPAGSFTEGDEIAVINDGANTSTGNIIVTFDLEPTEVSPPT